MRQSNFINVDERPVDYLDRENGGTSQGYFWIYRSAATGVLYDWQPGRAHTCLDNILTSGEKSFEGILQCDGYSAYETWAARHKGAIPAGCRVHARRKFKDADIILNHIRRLYHQEHRFQQWIAKSQHPPEAIIYYRRRYHKKLLKELRAKLHQFQKQHLPKSAMGKALGYAINQWHKLWGWRRWCRC